MFNDYFNRVGFMWLCFMYLHFFVLIQKNEAKKNQDCACFAQKTYARLTKSFKLATSLLKHERFLTSILLVFWLTRQGRFVLCNLTPECV